MAKYRVPLYKTPGKSAVIDTSAGAVSSALSSNAPTATTPTVTSQNTSVRAVLSNPISTIVTNPNGTGGDFSSAVGTCYVFNGDEDVTGLNDAVNGPVYSLVGTTAGMTATIDPVTGAYSASLDDTHDRGEADFKVVYGSTTMHAAFTVVKNLHGQAVHLDSDFLGFKYNNNTLISGQPAITLTASLVNLTGTVTWATSPVVTLGGSGNTRTLAASDFDALGVDALTVSATMNGITSDLIIIKLTPGADNYSDNVNFDNLIINGDMSENGYWDLTNAAYVTSTITGTTGNSLELTEVAGSYTTAYQLDSSGNRRYLRVSPGDRLFLVGSARRGGTNSATCALQLTYTDSSKGSPQYANITMNPTSTGVTKRQVFLVPSGASYVSVLAQINNDGSGGTTCEYKNIELYKNTYQYSSADTAGSTDFTYTSTTTSITVSWTGLTIYWADGSQIAVPDGSQTFSSLTAGTTYTFYPYWDLIASTLNFQGAANASPSYDNAQLQNAYTHAPLGVLSASTPASGTGGGSGGGWGACLHPDEPVETLRGKITADDLKEGDTVLTESGHSRVRIVRRSPQNHWILLTLSNGVVHRLTPTQPVILWDGERVRAEALRVTDFVKSSPCLVGIRSIEAFDDPRRKVTIEIEDEHHLYFTQTGGALLQNGVVKP